MGGLTMVVASPKFRDVKNLPAARLLELAEAAGLRVKADLGYLVVHGPASSDIRMIQSLLAAKYELMLHLLKPTHDEMARWTERAAIAEHDGGSSRTNAATLAWAELQAAREP
jgi:hypothetical protein